MVGERAAVLELEGASVAVALPDKEPIGVSVGNFDGVPLAVPLPLREAVAEAFADADGAAHTSCGAGLRCVTKAPTTKVSCEHSSGAALSCV